ncbi:hypothetical protein H5410_036957 [Solanum commersonii]|uniref:Uncharacterized protein n=1 Tax=Solanum commersonii TaxID=4109 RepID=A0A9J5Y6D6_SOLCO|nr:hypothetical protein H5410_036957 [Solanum commersonii]
MEERMLDVVENFDTAIEAALAYGKTSIEIRGANALTKFLSHHKRNQPYQDCATTKEDKRQIHIFVKLDWFNCS